MKNNYFKGIIDIDYISKEEILNILNLMRILKEADYNGSVPKLLKNKTLAMLFEEASTRTRISFETAMTKLGGHAQYLKPGEIHLGEKESLYDTIKVLSRLTDAIFCRALKHKTILSILKYSDVPVFNGLSDYNHPTQVLGDFLTILEHKPESKKMKDLKFVFIGDRTNVCKSLMSISSKLGINFIHIGPKEYLSPKEWIEQSKINIKDSNSGSVFVSDDINLVKNADFIYTDLWWWIGQEKEAPKRYKDFINGGYQVNKKLLNLAGPNCKIMHCLPCSRNVELSDEIFDGKNSIVFDQTENKLYSAMGVLVWYIFPNTIENNIEKEKKYKKKILNIFKNKLDNQKDFYKKYSFNNDYENKLDYLKDFNKKKKEKNKGIKNFD